MEALTTLIGFIAAFALIFAIAYMYYTTRNRERMALIEKGADATIFSLGKTERNGSLLGNLFNPLKIGLFLIGGGIGVVAGYLVGVLGMDEGASYTSMIFVFAGLGLVAYYLISRKSK